jgi:hypothetical protein
VSFFEQLEAAIKGFTAALLPWPESEKCGRAWGVDVAPYSGLLGLIEGPGGALLFFFGAIAYMQGASLALSDALLENWQPGLSTQHFQGGGLIGLLAWCLHPMAWIFIIEGLTGTLRLISFATTRQPVGEPSVWLLLRLITLLRRATQRGIEARNMGPLRPDRLRWDAAGCDLEIVSCRQRDEWSGGIGLEVEGRFFRPLGSEERVEGPHHVIAYRFEELDENEVIRRMVAYQDIVTDHGDRSAGM